MAHVSTSVELLIDEQPAGQFPTCSTTPQAKIEHSAQEREHRQRRERHWTILVASLVICVMSVAFSVRGTGDNATIAWWGIELPPLCSSRAWFGVECPGCGLTRSFVALAAGDFVESLRHHRVGWLLALAVLLQLPYRSYQLWKLPSIRTTSRWANAFGYLLIVALIGNWLLKAFSL